MHKLRMKLRILDIIRESILNINTQLKPEESVQKPKTLSMFNLRTIREQNAQVVLLFKNKEYDMALNLFQDLLKKLQSDGGMILENEEIASLRYNIGSIFQITQKHIDAIPHLE